MFVTTVMSNVCDIILAGNIIFYKQDSCAWDNINV